MKIVAHGAKDDGLLISLFVGVDVVVAV